MGAQLEITLIGRQGCHLCLLAQDTLAQVIARFAAEFPNTQYTVNDLDVDSDQELLDAYSDEVPVLLINGQQVAFLKIEPDRVFAKLVSLVDA